MINWLIDYTCVNIPSYSVDLCRLDFRQNQLIFVASFQLWLSFPSISCRYNCFCINQTINWLIDDARVTTSSWSADLFSLISAKKFNFLTKSKLTFYAATFVVWLSFSTLFSSFPNQTINWLIKTIRINRHVQFKKTWSNNKQQTFTFTKQTWKSLGIDEWWIRNSCNTSTLPRTTLCNTDLSIRWSPPAVTDRSARCHRRVTAALIRMCKCSNSRWRADRISFVLHVTTTAL